MYRVIFYIFLCVCTVQAAPKKTNGTPPLTVIERSNRLKAFQNFLKTPIYALSDLNLFRYKIEEEDEEVPEDNKLAEEINKVQKIIECRHDDLLVLQAVGKAIKPDGNMATNGQYVLCMDGYRILKPGDVLYAKYKGMNYPISLKSVTRNQFTLKLNEQELTFQY